MCDSWSQGYIQFDLSRSYKRRVKRSGSSRKIRSLLQDEEDGCWGRDKKADATPIRLLLWQFPALKGWQNSAKGGDEGKEKGYAMYDSPIHNEITQSHFLRSDCKNSSATDRLLKLPE